MQCKFVPKYAIDIEKIEWITSVIMKENDELATTVDEYDSCFLPILDYTPKYFLENEINPYCKLCYEKSSDENSDIKNNEK